MHGLIQGWPRILVHLVAIMPLVLLIWDLAHGGLTADPVREATLRTGKAALVLLLLSLACTPAHDLLRFVAARRFRRTLGLHGFGYAVLHLGIILGPDYRLDLELVWLDLFEKRYALAGLAAFLLLVPLAATSTRGWVRRLGKGWGRLHRLAYPAALLAVVHYVWLAKGDVRGPMAYGALLLLLLLLRLPILQRAVNPRRRGLRGAGGRPAPPSPT